MASYDTVIIGGGPAGLTAGIYMARAMKRVLIIRGYSPGGQLTTTSDVENFPGFPDGIQGPELIDLMTRQAEKFGAEIKDELAIDITKQSTYVVHLDSGHEIDTKSVIIATGANAKYLGLANELRLIGSGVSACATCDAFFFKNKVVAVVGGGDSAMEESLYLSKFASKVKLIHRGPSFRASQIMIDRVLANNQIEIFYSTVVLDVLGADKVDGLALEGSQGLFTMPVDGLFLAIGHKPNTDFLKHLNILDEEGYVVKDKLPSGMFVCGDSTDKKYRQAITAAGSGCIAALDCINWLDK